MQNRNSNIAQILSVAEQVLALEMDMIVKIPGFIQCILASLVEGAIRNRARLIVIPHFGCYIQISTDILNMEYSHMLEVGSGWNFWIIKSGIE